MDTNGCEVFWGQHNDIILAIMRTNDYFKEFDTRNWNDIFNLVDEKYWDEMSRDSRLTRHFTGEQCYQRFVQMVEKYNYLRSLPRDERQ